MLLAAIRRLPSIHRATVANKTGTVRTHILYLYHVHQLGRSDPMTIEKTKGGPACFIRVTCQSPYRG
jgi:hypothetical protein